MCVPWTGFPLRALLKSVEPKPEARYVAFQTFNKPDEAPGIRRASDLPWPYTEGLSIEEVAGVFRLEKNNVSVRLHRIRLRLKAEMER